jgi:hypothetical protein
VLDPACGSGNFLYVTLEHLKRLEGEVLNQLEELGETQARLEVAGLTVDPHQFLGLEINPRAAAIAELVLWIGYLQWHFRTRGHVMPEQPVLRDFQNIEHRDAVLAYDRVELVTDERGVPVSRWDGRTTKKHPVTGEEVPDETARVPIERYVNPRKAEWPEADFVVGNPPFIGAGNIRRALGDGYAEALRSTWKDIPESADFVMYWWHHAAELARKGKLTRFGLITTNSLRQAFNRRVVAPHLSDPNGPLSLVFAIPDHPWVDTADGAAVRIAMTVGTAGQTSGRLLRVVEERSGKLDDMQVDLDERRGLVHADLSVGPNVAAAMTLEAMTDISNPGVKLHGAGFIVSPEEAANLGLGAEAGLDRHIRAYRNGRDITNQPRGVMVIDLFGLTAEEVRAQYPKVYQHVIQRVKPERDQNKRESRRQKWWLFGETNPKLRKQLRGLPRYIVTVETMKHRVFQFLDATILPDNMLTVIAQDDAAVLGILSGRLHVTWALATGGRLGVGNDPRYNKSRCFETFPFPTTTDAQAARIRALAEELDAHRKRQQAAHPGLTLTGMYNVLEKLKSGEPLTPKEREVHEQGLVSILKQLHDELDLAVLDAYGWGDLAPLMEIVNGNAQPATAGAADREEAGRTLDETLLERLVALNAERAAEERRGLVRWLRPDFQQPESAPAAAQDEIDLGEVAAAAAPVTRRPWPKTLTEQVKAVAEALASTPEPVTEAELAARFTARGPWRRRLANILEMLVTLGQARQEGAHYRAVGDAR